MAEYICKEKSDGFGVNIQKERELIRCKDCKHTLPSGFCHKHSRKVTDGWFCADGERKEGR